jgi:hypothetical protein
MDSEQWFAALRAARKQRPEMRKARAEIDDKTTPDEIAYWVDEFADAPPDESPTNPFPPGYAEDTAEE